MPPTNPEMTKKLREIFYRPGLTIVPGGSTPYHAMLTERGGLRGVLHVRLDDLGLDHRAGPTLA